VAGSRTCAKVFRRKDKSNKQWIIGLSDMEFGMVSLANLHIPIMRRCRKEGSFLSQSKRFRSRGRRPFRIVLRWAGRKPGINRFTANGSLVEPQDWNSNHVSFIRRNPGGIRRPRWGVSWL